MKRTAALALVALAVLGRAGSAPAARGDETAPAPKLVFQQKDYLFDAVAVGTSVTHAFKFKNAGNADLIIRRVDPTCHCTASGFPRDPVKPGGEGAIELVVDTTEKMGAALVRATVYSNDPSQNAIGPCTTILEIKGEVYTSFKLMPLGAYYAPPTVRGRQPITREIRVSGTREAEAGFEVTNIEIPTDWIAVEQRPLSQAELSQANAKKGFCFSVSILPSVPVGDFREWVIVHTNLPSQPTFRFPVVGTASGPIKYNETCMFGAVRHGADRERVVALERVDSQKGLEILGFEYDEKLFEAKPEIIVDGARTDLRFTLRPGVPIGPFASQATVRLDVPEEPIVRIALLGTVLPRVQADPPLLMLKAGEAEAQLLVRIEKGGKLLSADSESFSVKIDAGSTATLHLTPKKPLASGEKGSIVLKTDVLGEETVLVPVEVR
jgi:hypothetical protein